MKFSHFLVVAILMLTVACRHTEVAEPLAASAGAPVEVHVTARDAAAAEEAAGRALEQKQQESVAQAVEAVERGLLIPDTYGRTVVISRDSEPVKIPPGPMEQLVRRNVDMRLTNASVRDVVMALSEIEGLNIIADQSLTEQQRLDIAVKDVPLQELLSYIARNMGIAFHVSANTIWVTAGDTADSSGPNLETRIFKLRRGFVPSLNDESGDSDLENALTQFLAESPPQASFRIFADRNVLIVRNSRENIRLVEAFLETFDAFPPQVLIEARFINLTQQDFYELGIDIQEFTADAGEKLQVDASSLFPSVKAADALGGKLSLTGVIGNKTYDIILRALAENDAVRTLSSPRVTVLNNRTAVIEDGRREYYYEEYDLETVDVGDEGTETRLVPVGSPTEMEFGISLEVKVNVGNNGRSITLSLHPRVTVPDGDGFEEFAVGDTGTVRLPKFFESSVQTTVAVESGETVVLGGTMSNSKSSKVKKVPLLGDIPLIGLLFRHVSEENSPKHLLIFVTATVVGQSGEFLNIVESGPSL
jgi:type II secretory pathway component GspD/PulD (secretin)